MKLKGADPKEVAIALLSRSVCRVRVAAVLVDPYGIFSWGWNHSGLGYGMHAEAHCMSRANWKRLRGATLYVAAARPRTWGLKTVTAKPCEACQDIIREVGKVVWRDGSGEWKSYQIPSSI